MDSKNILTADLLDLVFDNRNKDYGAYELRRFYNHRIGKALLITGTLVGITFTSIALSTKLRPDEPRVVEKMTTVVIKPLEQEKPIQPIIPEAAKPQPAAQPIRSEIFTNFNITQDDEVPTPPPDQQTLQDARISNVSVPQGADDTGIPINNAIGDGNTGIIEQPAVKEPEIFSIVQVEAKFTGNWEKFLTRNLNPNTPVDNGAAPGRYTVLVQFVVDIDGSVSDIRPLSSMGFGMEAEAIRVLKKATKWEPAIQNGHQVKAYRKQPITFVVSEE